MLSPTNISIDHVIQSLYTASIKLFSNQAHIAECLSKKADGIQMQINPSVLWRRE